jgi:hypothetical protein
MKKIKLFFTVFMLIIVTIMTEINGQVTDCYAKYEKALVLYNSGMSDSTLAMLRPCLENKENMSSVPQETRARIYRLAALSSIMQGNATNAEDYVRQLLINQPDYMSNPNPDDLMEFKQIVERIEVKPSMRLGIRAGTNYPLLKLQKQYSNYTLNTPEFSFKSSFGYQLGLFWEKALSGNLSVKAEAGVARSIFNYEVTGTDPLTSQTVNNAYEQNITFLEIPVGAKYYFGKHSIKPYVEAGISGRFLLNEMEKSDTYGNYWFTGSENTGKILTTFLSDIMVGITAGGGAVWDLSKFSLSLNVRYCHYFNSSGVVSNFDEVTGYEDIPSSEKFHYTDDINILNLKSLQISAGIMYTLKYKVF